MSWAALCASTQHPPANRRCGNDWQREHCRRESRPAARQTITCYPDIEKLSQATLATNEQSPLASCRLKCASSEQEKTDQTERPAAGKGHGVCPNRRSNSRGKNQTVEHATQYPVKITPQRLTRRRLKRPDAPGRDRRKNTRTQIQRPPAPAAIPCVESSRSMPPANFAARDECRCGCGKQNGSDGEDRENMGPPGSFSVIITTAHPVQPRCTLEIQSRSRPPLHAP